MAETCLLTARPLAFSIDKFHSPKLKTATMVEKCKFVNQRRQRDLCFQLTCTKSTQVWYLAGLLVVQCGSSLCTRPRDVIAEVLESPLLCADTFICPTIPSPFTILPPTP